jgi:phage shock protein PspC (stress-responsive transcriptional regulator)
MDESTDANEVHIPPELGAPVDATTLHRSTSKKIFGGVAGGISERFDVDANIVRVVFVVLALVYGLGVAIYLAMWALIPRSAIVEGAESDAVDVEDENRFHWLRYALPLGVLVLALIFFATFRGLPKWGAGFSLFWLLFIIVLALFALRIPARRLTLRRFFALGFLAFLSLIIFFVGASLIALQVIGVPLKGGSGVHVWHPVTVSEVQRDYHGAIGKSTVDLTNVPFADKTYAITATQGVGQLTVEIPFDVTVDLRTHVGIGNVRRYWVPYNFATPVASTPKPATTPEPRLVLNLQVGVGMLQLVRYRH